LTLATNTIATRLVVSGRRIVAVDCLDRRSREPVRYRARSVALAAGALATPQLILASGLAELSTAGDAVGRYLMRHCNAVVMGAFLRQPAPNREFHKQVGIHDYYFGHPSIDSPPGKLGCIQQWGTPQVDYVLNYLTGWKRLAARMGVPHTTGLIVIAEDQPRRDNRVSLMPDSTTAFGVPGATISHTYTARDLAARRALVGSARRILRRAGALRTFEHDILTFSHAAGTVRLGPDPARSPLDSRGAYRGLDNLYVTDGSALPKAGGVNPSLTIAANALRTGERIVDGL
jgi:choline dehydrogenase-like flavoprotein